MEYRQLGSSGLRVPALSFGTGTFGGHTPYRQQESFARLNPPLV